jgi:hypothetical protein
MALLGELNLSVLRGNYRLILASKLHICTYTVRKKHICFIENSEIYWNANRDPFLAAEGSASRHHLHMGVYFLGLRICNGKYIQCFFLLLLEQLYAPTNDTSPPDLLITQELMPLLTLFGCCCIKKS